MLQIGMLGFSPGNGHPFSFSAIINGYNKNAFQSTGWPGILEYLEKQPIEFFGFQNVRVTHAWSEDISKTKKLCEACHIPNAATSLEELKESVDAVIVARDDAMNHVALAKPFLESGKYVFIDKPLTLDQDELDYFIPYIEKGILMSTSGLRYAIELDEVRENVDFLGNLVLIEAVVLNDFEKYGIHMIDAISGLGFGQPISITRQKAIIETFYIELDSGIPFLLSCLGSVSKVFHIGLYGAQGKRYYEINNNFMAFRRTLRKFFEMVNNNVPPIDPKETYRNISLLIKGRAALAGETIRIQ